MSGWSAVGRVFAAALALFVFESAPPVRAQEYGRPLKASRRDDALKARRPHCMPVEGRCPSVFGPPSSGVAQDTSDGSRAGRPPLWRVLLGETVDIYSGVAFTPRTRYGRRRDGTLLVGGAFGDPGRALGIDIGLAFFSTLDTGLGERVGLDLELSRLLPGDLLMSVGWENIARRGYTDIGSSRYVVLTRWFASGGAGSWLSHVVLSAGAADGRFSSERNWIDGTEGWNLVGSAGVQVAKPLLLIVEWPGDDLTVGAAIAPSPALPLVLTPAITDVTGFAGDGARFIISATYVLRLRIPS